MFVPVRLLTFSAAVVEPHAAATFLERFAVGGHIALRVGTSMGKERKSCIDNPATDISTCPYAPASEWLSGKYILVCTCPKRKADFLRSLHIFIYKVTKLLEIC